MADTSARMSKIIKGVEEGAYFTINRPRQIGRLLFLSYLKPIINGRGFDFKEPTVAEEGRMDVVVTYNDQRNVIELNRREGETYHRQGLQQLSDYLDIYFERRYFSDRK